MIYNEEINFIQSQPYEILIVGGGAVGLTLASSLAYEKINICVVESGLGFRDPKFQKHKNLKTNGLNIKPDSRERMLGGSGQTWKGQLAYFDQCDFLDRGDKYPALGLDSDEITGLLDKFGKFFKIPNSSYFNVRKYQKSQFSLGNQFKEKVFLRQSPVFKFGDRLKHIFERKGIDLILGWTIFNLQWEGNRCNGVMISDQNGNIKLITAKKIVLCAGAIENIRLLKIAQNQKKLPSSLPIGERFMNHPKGIVCSINLNKPISLDDPVFKLQDNNGFTGCVGFRLDDKYVTSNKLSNVYFRFLSTRNVFFNYSSRDIISLLRSFSSLGLLGFTKKVPKLIFSAWKFRNGLLGIINELFIRCIDRFGFIKNTTKSVKIQIFSEMSSEKTNFVTLTDDTVIENQLIPIVKHSLSSNDLRSIEDLIGKLQRIVSQNKIGKIIFSKKNLSEQLNNDSSHHIGGTRISLDGDEGVVNSNFKVISTENLYVCGGSILRSSGHSNPTMFFVGMALKLGKFFHLQSKIMKKNNSFFNFKNKINQINSEIIIIGAGRRVREDVLPVFESLVKNHKEISVYAKNESGILGSIKPYEVRALKDLSTNNLAETKIIYVAVPVDEAITVAKLLIKVASKKIKIIWDTPISKKVYNALSILKKYKKFVAEDSSYLPWIELLSNLEGKKIKKILIDRGGYKYHATAIANEIYKKLIGNQYLKITNIKKTKYELSYLIGGHLNVIIKLPRSYKKGLIKLVLYDESVITLGGEGAASSIKIIRNSKGQCSGFSFGVNKYYLSEKEIELIGYSHTKEDIVSMMLRLKRVGLRRLIVDTLNNNSKLNIKDANFDAELF